MTEIHQLQLDSLINKTLEEEDQHRNWSADICHLNQENIQLHIHAKNTVLISGIEVVESVFKKIDPTIFVDMHKRNGVLVQPHEIILSISGATKTIVKAYDLALNFFSRMCGLSTLTARFVDKLSATHATLFNTRSFTPGLKLLEKSAIAVGGAHNHKLFFKQGVLITQQHIEIAGSLNNLMNQLIETLPATIKIEVEINRLEDLHEAIDAGANLVILKNMNLATIKMAVQTVQKKVLLEASSDYDLDTAQEVAKTGVDFISTSYLIQAAPRAELYSTIRKI